MAVGTKPSIMRAPSYYSAREQDHFRRELELFILNSLSYVLSVSNGSDPQSSHTHKRHQYHPAVELKVVS